MSYKVFAVREGEREFTHPDCSRNHTSCFSGSQRLENVAVIHVKGNNMALFLCRT